VPLTTTSHCYVFGIGLPEAIARTYEREDIRVVRFGTDGKLDHHATGMYKFKYDSKSGKLMQYTG
jgi:hypothetical protein